MQPLWQDLNPSHPNHQLHTAALQMMSQHQQFQQQTDESSTNSVDDHQKDFPLPLEPSLLKHDSFGMGVEDPFGMVLVDQGATSLFLSPPTVQDTTMLTDQVFPFDYQAVQAHPHPMMHNLPAHQAVAMQQSYQQPTMKFLEAHPMPCDLLITPEAMEPGVQFSGKRKRSDSCPEEPQLKRVKSKHHSDYGNGQLFFLPDPNRVVTLNDQRKNKLRINKQFSQFFPLENSDIFVNGNRARFIKSDCSIRFKKIDYRMMGLRAGVRAQFKKIRPLTFTIEAVHFIREMKEKKKKPKSTPSASNPQTTNQQSKSTPSP